MPVSPNYTTSNERVLYNITVTESDINVSNNSSKFRVVVRAWRTNTGYETYGTGTCDVKVGTLSYSEPITPSQKITNAGIVFFDKTFNANHLDDGSYKITITAKININGVLSSNYQGQQFTLTKIPVSAAAITSFNITAGHGNSVGLGDVLTLNWTADASYPVTGYQIQYYRGSSGWKTWYNNYQTTKKNMSIKDSFTSTNININGAGRSVRYRVRAINGSQYSAWKTSNTLVMSGGMDLNVNGAWKLGSTWINVNGQWKRAKRVWIKQNGLWQISK